jgi:hypothetical protein
LYAKTEKDATKLLLNSSSPAIALKKGRLLLVMICYFVRVVAESRD